MNSARLGTLFPNLNRMKLIMKTKSIFLLLFCTLIFLAAPAAGLTDKTTNGDFEDGLNGWSVDYDTNADGYASITHQPGLGVDGTGCAYFTLGAGGDTGGWAEAIMSQSIGSGTITQISYWYRYQATTGYSGYDPNPGTFKIYWGGELIDTVTLSPTSGTSWQQRTVTISDAEPIDSWLTFQASAYTSGTDAIQRTATVLVDNIEILSSGTPPIISSIQQSPASASDEKIPAPATITFTGALSQGSEPVTYSWDFTNDGTTDATGQTAIYTYPQAGTYTCRLTVYNGEGAVTQTTTVYVDNPLPQGDFYASPISGNAPLDVQFILTATGSGETYQWWFGDGNNVNDAPDSTAAQPTHRYTEEGVYDVRLIITNSVGSVTINKSQLITVNAEGSSSTSTGIGSIYAPHSVQMMFEDVWGNPISGLEVTFESSSSSGPLDEILKWFGITNAQAITGDQKAITSADGTISWLALPQIQYEVSYIWEGQIENFLLYPQDTEYVIRVGEAQRAELGEAVAEFNMVESADYTEITLSVQYYKQDTNNVLLWVKADGELIYSQSYSGNRMNASVSVPNSRGITYTWGYNASLTDGTTLEDGRKHEALGNPKVPVWDLGIQNYGYGQEWYMYIAFGITLLVASLFYSTVAKQGAVVVGLFLGGIFLFVRWIPLEYSPLISLAAGLALLATASKDGREIRFDSIILLIALSGAIIGLVNGTSLFGGGFASSTIEYDFSLEQFSSIADADIWTTGYTFVSIVQTLMSMAFSALQMLVFAAPMLLDLGLAFELVAVVQVAIWVVVLMWVLHDLLPRVRG